MPSKSFLKSHQSLQTHLCAFSCVYITSRDHASHSHTSQCCPVAVLEILGNEILPVASFNSISCASRQLLGVLKQYDFYFFSLRSYFCFEKQSMQVLPLRSNPMSTKTQSFSLSSSLCLQAPKWNLQFLYSPVPEVMCLQLRSTSISVCLCFEEVKMLV